MRTEPESEMNPQAELKRLQMDLDTNREYLAKCMAFLRSLTDPQLTPRVVFNIDGVEVEPTPEEFAPSIRRRAFSLQHRITALEAQIATEIANLKDPQND